MKNLIFACALSFLAVISYGQVQNNPIARIDVWNIEGQNPHDFIFSYDIINGNHTCINNFEVVSNVSFATTFDFQIYMNDVLVYTGRVTTAPYGSVFFNDAFVNCNSLNAMFRIVVI